VAGILHVPLHLDDVMAAWALAQRCNCERLPLHTHGALYLDKLQDTLLQATDAAFRSC